MKRLVYVPVVLIALVAGIAMWFVAYNEGSKMDQANRAYNRNWKPRIATKIDIKEVRGNRLRDVVWHSTWEVQDWNGRRITFQEEPDTPECCAVWQVGTEEDVWVSRKGAVEFANASPLRFTGYATLLAIFGAIPALSAACIAGFVSILVGGGVATLYGAIRRSSVGQLARWSIRPFSRINDWLKLQRDNRRRRQAERKAVSPEYRRIRQLQAELRRMARFNPALSVKRALEQANRLEQMIKARDTRRAHDLLEVMKHLDEQVRDDLAARNQALEELRAAQ